MKTYLYVPKKLDESDFYAQAKESNINEIIHGESDIVREHIEDWESPCVIKIPEYKGFWMEKFVFEEGESIPLIVIDEWVHSDSYKSIIAVVHKVNIEDPSIMYFLKEFPMAYDNFYSFYETLEIDEYGEYYLEIFADYGDGNKKCIDSKELIVYKKEEKRSANFDFGI